MGEADDMVRAELERTASERNVYDAHLAEWMPVHAGKWVLIKGTRSFGFFGSFEDAFDEGDRLFPDEDLFIKRVADASASEPLSLGLLHGVLVVDE